MTPKTFAYIMAALYFVLVFLFVSTSPVAIALGTAAMWWAALNMAYLSFTLEGKSMWEASMYLKGIRL